VVATGERLQFDKGIARCRVTVDGNGQFDHGQPPVACLGGLRAGGRSSPVVMLPRQRMVDQARFRWPAAHNGEVGLVDFIVLELSAQFARCLWLEGEQQYARGPPVEPMHRLHAAADLVAQQLHGEARLVTVDVAAMDKQAGRLVDGDEIIVAVEDVEHGRSVCGIAAMMGDKTAREFRMTQHTFRLEKEFIELHNLLKLLALASSGGMAKAMVAAGEVIVDGEVETRKSRKLRAGQVVRLGDEEIQVVA